MPDLALLWEWLRASHPEGPAAFDAVAPSEPPTDLDAFLQTCHALGLSAREHALIGLTLGACAATVAETLDSGPVLQ